MTFHDILSYESPVKHKSFAGMYFTMLMNSSITVSDMLKQLFDFAHIFNLHSWLAPIFFTVLQPNIYLLHIKIYWIHENTLRIPFAMNMAVFVLLGTFIFGIRSYAQNKFYMSVDICT